MPRFRALVGALAVIAPALMAGFFFAFSVCVMAGLDDSGGEVAIRAMQGINRAVRNTVFFAAYLAPPCLAAAAALLAWGSGNRRAGGLFAASALVYAAGVLAPTGVVNIPMNDALAALGMPAPDEAEALWQGYGPRWTAWNHLRTVISLAAAVPAIAAFRSQA